MSLKKKEHPEAESMGKALGIPDNGVLLSREEVLSMDLNEPLDKLLSDKSCLAGESVNFYIEVCKLNKLPTEDSVGRIYMARHIIQKYIVAGAEMEVNISHRTRQQILNTCNLADPDLFKNAMSELLELMKMVDTLTLFVSQCLFSLQPMLSQQFIFWQPCLLKNLARDYWSSIYYVKFRDEAHLTNGQDLELVMSLNVSFRLSWVHASEDPFHQQHHPSVFEHEMSRQAI